MTVYSSYVFVILKRRRKLHLCHVFSWICSINMYTREQWIRVILKGLPWKRPEAQWYSSISISNRSVTLSAFTYFLLCKTLLWDTIADWFFRQWHEWGWTDQTLHFPLGKIEAHKLIEFYLDPNLMYHWKVSNA